MADFLLKKARGYIKTWPTSIPGILLIINSLSGILVCIFDPDCGMNVITQEWDKFIMAIGGLGLLEARSVHARSEDVGIVVAGLLAGLLFAATGAEAGERDYRLETPTTIRLPEIPDVPEPNWMDRGSLWTFAWYNFSEEENGAGVRLSYRLPGPPLIEAATVRFDYLVAGFAFDEGAFADTSEATLSMRYDIKPGNKWFPYVIAGGGSASLSSFDFQYLIGAGVEYELDTGVTLFSEFLHIRDENGDSERNEFRIGAGISFETLTKIQTLWDKTTPTLPPVPKAN